MKIILLLLLLLYIEPDLERSKSAKKEYISFKHQYNCRSDPNEPIKGKVSIIMYTENIHYT